MTKKTGNTTPSNKRPKLARPKVRQRPLLSLAQVIVLIAVIGALVIALDLNRRAQSGRQVTTTEETVREQVNLELTRQVQLQVTVDYVQSEDFIADYARDEAGQLLPGERRVVPLIPDSTPLPTIAPLPTPDPAYAARPWQAWWRLLTDAPMPARE